MGRGVLAQVEQDELDDVRQNVYSYLATTRGERPLSPDFGLNDPSFGPGVNGDRLASEIMEAEGGRASVAIRVTRPDGGGRAAVDVTVELSGGQAT